MPGNENSDTVHNFFQLGNLSQNQQHTRPVEGNWSVQNNNPWGTSDRQNSGFFSSKNYAHQADVERAQEKNQFPLGSSGLKFAQSNPRPDFFKVQSQNQPLSLNGFIHAPEISHTRHDEGKTMGMDTESDRLYPNLRELHTLDSQQRNGPQHGNLNSSGFRTMDSHVNYHFLGNQQQMTGQQSGTALSMHRQQSGFGDIQQMQQQQLMLRQMQELQRQHQLQQLEVLQRNSHNQISSIPNQGINHRPAFSNDTSVHDGQNNPWSSQVMVGNSNVLQHGAHASVQGYTNGGMIAPDQGQVLQLMGSVPPQASHSLYGVPVSSSWAGSPLQGHVDKSGMLQAPGHNNSLSANRHASFPEQTGIREGDNTLNPSFENKGSFQHGFGPGSVDLVNVGYGSQIYQRNVSLQESRGKQDLIHSSETLPEKSGKHVSSSQAAVTLDPTEEKILFGNDDNIWEAFGGSLAADAGSNNNLDGALPSLQSGSWSALMQSAVAESESSAIPPQGGWSGVGVLGSLATNPQNSISQDGGKHQVAWVDDSQASSGSRAMANDVNIRHNSGSTFLPSFLNQRVSQQDTSSHHSEEGRKRLDNSRPPTPGDGRQVDNVYSSAELSSKGIAGASSHQPNLFSQGPKFKSKDERAIHNSSIANINQGAGQTIPDNRNFNFWRTVSSVRSETNESKYHQQRVLDPSVNNSVRGGSEMHETLNANRRENFNDNHSLNMSYHSPSGSFRDIAGPDNGKTHGSSGEKQASSGSGSSKSLGPRKFQYHPMGDIDMDGEPVNRQKHPMHSETMSHPLPDGLRSQERQSMFFHPGLGKGFASGAHGVERASYNHPSSTFHQGRVPHASVSDKRTPSSQNMLELLHKVDQPNEENNVRQSGSCMSAEASEGEASDGTVRHPKQSAASQSFGLQLAPPSQGLPVPNFNVAGESSSGFNSVIEDKANAWPPPGASIPPLWPLQQAVSRGLGSDNSPGHLCNEPSPSPSNIPSDTVPSKDQGNSNLLVSGSGYRRSQPRSEQVIEAGGKSMDNQSRQLPDVTVSSTSRLAPQREVSQLTNSEQYDPQREVSQLTNSEQYDSKPPLNQSILLDVSATSQPSFMYNVSGNANAATTASAIPANYATQQRLFRSQNANASNLFMSCQNTNHSMEARPSTRQEQENKHPFVRETALNSHMDVSGEENPERKTDTTVKMDNSPSTSAATQKEIEAFGRSLRPKSRVPDNYSTLQHMQAVQGSEVDHRDRQTKRFKGSEIGPDAKDLIGSAWQMFSGGVNSMVKNLPASSTLVTDGDASISDVTPEASNYRDKLLVGQNLSGTDATLRVEHPQISPQISQTWFDQFGSQKNGQLLSQHDARKSQSIPSLPQQLMNSKNFVADQSMVHANVAIDIGQIANQHPATTLVTGNPFCYPHPLASGVIGQVIESPRPKKRKSATSYLLSWHEEVALDSQRVQSLSSAHVEWARAANRLTEKPEDEFHMSGLLVHRARRRLILTTQLMQQLLRAPPAGILSLDASSNYDSVAYFVARLALGDACSMTYSSTNDSQRGSDNGLHEKPIASGTIRDQYLSKLTEDFTNRARKLEDLLRLDKQALTMDLKLECQDLERLSVINRFAKFHGRGPADGAETSSSSSTAAFTQKPVPQRYVLAYPMPKFIPDGVQCLSL